jgi:ketosteroid isomerase-like protein
MSQENVEIIRRLLEAFNEGGAEKALSFFDAGAVFEEPPEQPGSTVAQGRDEASRAFVKFDETWEEHRSEPEDFRVIDDDRVLVFTVEHFRGRDGLEITQPGGHIFTLRDGKVVRLQAFWERENAVKAAGISD